MVYETTILVKLVSLRRFLKVHWRIVSALCYRSYQGFCSNDLKYIILPKALFVNNTRFPNNQHLFAVKLDNNRTNAFAKSFIPMPSRAWNQFPATVFLATYN